ncbi:hypothetical protein GGQ87_001654 [Brevundimonas alba]|uniref:Uncharacterized protein n=1 Tax=Brevundimonas alba TaxID=74314 RepID=A0A7X5YK37_9CAUL|nr:hypothetical protein [Brevundimonas alba]NJC41396.1 hypothetical protein [Brevundimonas alba]
MKSVASAVVAASLLVVSAPAPARADDIFAGFVMSRVCLPFASRAKTFEGAIRAARDMEFRRPAGPALALEEWETVVELVSKDGRWRVRIEEGPAEGDVPAYSVTCGVSSNQASARELAMVARQVVRNNPRWAQSEGEPWRWDRVTGHPEEYTIQIDVTEAPGERAVLAARGFYY